MVIKAAKKFRDELFRGIDLESKEGKKFIEKIRVSNNVKKLSFWEWFYFHPTGYNLLAFGTPIILMVNFGIIGLLGYLYVTKFSMVIVAIVLVVASRDLYRKVKNRKAMKTMNLNDMWF